MTDTNPGVLARILDSSTIRCLETLHHTHDFSLSDATIRSKPWFVRWHPSVVWLRKGEMRTWRDGARPPVVRRENSVVYYPAGVRRRSDYLRDKADLVAATLSCESVAGINLLSCFEIPFLLPESAAAKLRPLLSALLELNPLPGDSGDLAEMLEYRAIASRIAGALIEVSRAKKEFAYSGIGRFQPVLEYIAAHYYEKIPMERLAHLCSLSLGQFHRQFKAALDLSPLEFIARKRLREAEKLLSLSDLGLQEIGEHVGWPDPFYFSRKFRKAYGISPSGYRKQHRPYSI